VTVLPETLSQRDVYFLMTSCIVPRPIALVTSVSPAGVINAAPFSFFNAVSANPPMVMLSIERRNGAQKDTTRNILSMKEYVINIVAESIAEQMNVTSGAFPPEVSEIEQAGFTLSPSTRVSVPHIAESPVQLECRLAQWIEVGGGPNDLILGEVVALQVNDEVFSEGRVDPRKLKAIGRFSGSGYCRTGDMFSMKRP
jgi:flavin reductase (DIM6/NTAB) family NADH-FMN oxidoreductase RutF